MTSNLHAACLYRADNLERECDELRAEVERLLKSGKGPWIPANPDDPLLALVNRLDVLLGNDKEVLALHSTSVTNCAPEAARLAEAEYDRLTSKYETQP